MNILLKENHVLLGMMSRMPVAGNAWLDAISSASSTGLRRLYVKPATPRSDPHGKGDASEVAPPHPQNPQPLNLGDRWATIIHAGSRYFGMSKTRSTNSIVPPL